MTGPDYGRLHLTDHLLFHAPSPTLLDLSNYSPTFFIPLSLVFTMIFRIEFMSIQD